MLDLYSKLKLLFGNVLILLSCICSFACNNAYGLEVFSDYAIYNMNARNVNFESNVKVVLENSTLIADNLEVNLFKDEMAIKSATAHGNLRIYNNLESATANKAIYNSSSNSLKLIGNVVIIRDGAEVKADQYNFNLKDKSSILNSNSSGRVKVKIDNVK